MMKLPFAFADDIVCIFCKPFGYDGKDIVDVTSGEKAKKIREIELHKQSTDLFHHDLQVAAIQNYTTV